MAATDAGVRAVDEAIRGRRTTKVYARQPVPRALLEELFELARWAPNHHLTEPWRFRVLGPAALARLKAAAGEGAAKLDRAPTLVVASAALTAGDPIAAREDLLAAACATYIVLLGAHARGLAGYWRTPSVLRTAEGRAAVHVGDGEEVLGLVHLGWAAREPAPARRSPPEAFATFLA